MAKKKAEPDASVDQQIESIDEYADIDPDLADVLREVDEELEEDELAPEEDGSDVVEDELDVSHPADGEPEMEPEAEGANDDDSESESDDEQPAVDEPSLEPDSASTDQDEPPSENEETLEADENAVAEAPVVPREGFWARIKRFFRRKKTTPAPVIETVTAEKPRDLKQELAKKKAELSRAQKVSARETSEAEKLQEKLEKQAEELERISSWVEGLERSYFWNVRKEMAANLQRGSNELQYFQESVESVTLPEKGELVGHRQRFHKNLGIGILLFGIPTALLFFIPWFAEAALPTWLLDFLNSPWFTVTLVALIVSTLGITILVRRAVGKTRVPSSRVVKAVLYVIALPVLVLGVSRLQTWLLTYVVPFIDRWIVEMLVGLGIGFFFYLIGILAYYYSGWSQFSRSITEQLNRLDNVEKGYLHAQREMRRLNALYEQTAQWLELLAHSLYRPWKVDPAWETDANVRITSETFPFSLRVAQAVDNENSQIANLERLIGKRLMTQGWRNEAFEDTLAAIGQQLGFDEDHVTAEFLDADLPHQTNNSRALVRSFFEKSAATAQKGRVVLNDEDTEGAEESDHFSDNYLVAVARKRFKELIETTQSSVLSEARPSVAQIVEDPLEKVRDSVMVIDGNPSTKDWDEFLTDGIGREDVVHTPLSTMTFTDEGTFARNPESVSTHLLIPERLKATVPPASGDAVRIHPVGGASRTRSAEMVVRFDVVGPVPFSHVQVLRDAEKRTIHAPETPASDDGEL